MVLQFHLINGLFTTFVILIMGVLGLGLIISSMVTKYRDLIYLIGFGVQLLMYISGVLPDEFDCQ
jgi:lipopolysaccharide transport system permease protein